MGNSVLHGVAHFYTCQRTHRMPLPASDTPLSGKIFPAKRLLNLGFRALVVLLLGAALYIEVSGKQQLPEMTDAFLRQISEGNASWLFLTLVLLPLNWFAEAAKWRPFIRLHEPMSWRKSFFAVMTGVTFSLFTPNRVGEYAGRLLFVQRENHWKALMANALGSFAQLIVLLSFGLSGGLWFALNIWGRLHWTLPAFAGAVFAISLLYAVFFNIKTVLPLLKRVPFVRRMKNMIRDAELLAQAKRKTLAAVLAWSAFRYLIYCTQYFFLLQFFGIHTGLAAGYAGIATIFLVQTVLPLPAVAGLLVRGNLALFVWSDFSSDELCILSATFLLWIINLILPALLGTFSLFYVRIAKTLGYEDE